MPIYAIFDYEKMTQMQFLKCINQIEELLLNPEVFFIFSDEKGFSNHFVRYLIEKQFVNYRIYHLGDKCRYNFSKSETQGGFRNYFDLRDRLEMDSDEVLVLDT